MPGYVHVKKRLTDVSMRFPPEQPTCGQDYFPRKNVEHLSDFIAKHNKANILRLDELAMSDYDWGSPPEIEIVLDADDSYQCRVYAVSAPDKQITKRNADPSVDWEVERSLLLKQHLETRLEYLRVKQTLRATAIMTNNQTLGATERFDNTTSSANTPVALGQAIVTAMTLRNGGNPPNVVRMGRHVLNAIVTSEEFKDYYKFNVATKGEIVGNEAAVASAWGLAPGTVKTCDATYNAAAAGDTPSYKTFLGSDIVFAYVVPAGMRSYGLSTEFRFSGYNTDPYAIISVPQLNRGPLPGEELRGISICDPHVINADAGFLLKGCVDTTASKYGGFLD